MDNIFKISGKITRVCVDDESVFHVFSLEKNEWTDKELSLATSLEIFFEPFSCMGGSAFYGLLSQKKLYAAQAEEVGENLVRLTVPLGDVINMEGNLSVIGLIAYGDLYIFKPFSKKEILDA